MTDLRQSSQYGKYLEKTGWTVDKISEAYIFVRKVPFTPFSIIKIQRPEKIPNLIKVKKLAKKYRALVVYIEPSVFKSSLLASRLNKNGYKLSKSPFLPTKTTHLDLSQSEKELLKQMKKDSRHILKKLSQTRSFKIKHYSKGESFWPNTS